jgi:basic membrane lipoprotein Med (substrate-binding protein (PBP1-ABC) superfamily)
VTSDLPCLRELYVAHVVDDPSEVGFAEAVFNDVRYWMRLRKASFMEKPLKEWEEIVEAKRKQKAFKAVMNEVENEGRSCFSAAKYLIEESWKSDKNTKVGKKRITETKKTALDPFKDDLERLEERGLLQ